MKKSYKSERKPEINVFVLSFMKALNRGPTSHRLKIHRANHMFTHISKIIRFFSTEHRKHCEQFTFHCKLLPQFIKSRLFGKPCFIFHLDRCLETVCQSGMLELIEQIINWNIMVYCLFSYLPKCHLEDTESKVKTLSRFLNIS